MSAVILLATAAERGLVTAAEMSSVSRGGDGGGYSAGTYGGSGGDGDGNNGGVGGGDGGGKIDGGEEASGTSRECSCNLHAISMQMCQIGTNWAQMGSGAQPESPVAETRQNCVIPSMSREPQPSTLAL
eukprot:6210918-Pleurochrysis_carterae.AAC.6